MKEKEWFQVAWGMALVGMGVAVFFRISHVMGKVSRIAYFAGVPFLIRLSFYLMAILLIGGGIKKVYGASRSWRSEKPR